MNSWVLCHCLSALAKNQYGDEVMLPRATAFKMQHLNHVKIIDEIDKDFADLPGITLPGITLVTRLMGRVSQLIKTLPTWLPLEVEKIVIVDWGMVEPVDRFVDNLMDPRIAVLHVPNQLNFEAGKSWNVGIRYAKTEYILAVDADVMVRNPHLVKYILRPGINPRAFYVCETVGMALTGTCLFKKAHWQEINGYIEGLRGYGYEDIDFLKRLEGAGYLRINNIQPEWLQHLDHGDRERTMNMQVKTDKHSANLENRLIAERTDVLTQEREPVECYIHEKGISQELRVSI